MKFTIKKNKETVCWELIPNIFEYKILLILSDESFYTVVKKLNKNYNFGWEEGKDFDKSMTHVSDPCVIANEDERMCAILLPDWTDSTHDHSVLAHELTHIITLISENIQQGINQITTETWAYFMSFYMKVCIECLNEHLDEEDMKLNDIVREAFSFGFKN
jgi:hypothetical protein